MREVIKVMNNMMNNMLVGKRVELVKMNDPYTTLPPGTQGTIIMVDDLGTIHVKWDNGSTLGLIPGEDIYKIVE